jgi:uncharacterized protein YcbK (DUF882 family)
MKISEHISAHEVACKCGCGFGNLPGDMHSLLLSCFEDIRAKVSLILKRDTPIRITSGCRCHDYNARLPYAVKKSYHTHGMALDLIPPAGITYNDFYDICDKVIGDKGAVIRYTDERCIHIDVRGYYRRSLIFIVVKE